MRNKRSRNPYLGDAPIDQGSKQVVRPTDGGAANLGPNMQPPRSDEYLRQVMQDTWYQQQNDFLNNLRAALEQTRNIAFQSAVNDTPFRGNAIMASTGRITINAGVTTTAFSRVVAPQHGMVIREAVFTIFDQQADADLEIRVLSNNSPAWSPWPNNNLSPSDFIGLGRNFYSKVVIDGAQFQINVENTSALVQHEFQLQVFGWEFPIDKTGDTSMMLMNPK